MRKSCLFDGIRLLKSAYGGNEYEQWFGEFNINLNHTDQVHRMFRDRTQPVELSATLQFSESERSYIKEHAADLLWPFAWQRITNRRVDFATFSRASVGPREENFLKPANELVSQLLPQLLHAIERSDSFRISLVVTPDGQMNAEPCLPVEVVFPTDIPRHLGLIEYHSASRAYSREQIGGINLDPTSFESERRQHRLYNWQAKYRNVKTELVTGYLRSLIAEKAGEERAETDLNETLKELFRTFFPDKEYLGITPQRDGHVEFPVRLPEGETHDIDELSSGEKEILYGYLRLRNSTPRHSVVLLDEPELHLNPGLLEGFADFYYRHLGVAQKNQLWLVTHSDTLLRQAIGNANYGVYHMQTANTASGNQASEVLREDDVERAVMDLVGDLAAYRPHAKVVILEGTTKDGFDELFIRRMFPDFAKQVNLVSAESKKRVMDLYGALNESATQAGMRNRFFAIVDKDAEGFREQSEEHATAATWDVYHIENYLLHVPSVREAATSAAGDDPFDSDQAVLKALHAAATEIVDRLVLQEIQSEINDELVSSIRVRAAPDSEDIPADLLPSVESSLKRIEEHGAVYTAEYFQNRVAELRAEFQADLASDAWLQRFPGREILKRFAAVHLPCDYITFRNVIMDKMVLSDYRPESMDRILKEILEADQVEKSVKPEIAAVG
jgi:AAA domain, putative AbiEii toxin, Type IV TA system